MKSEMFYIQRWHIEENGNGRVCDSNESFYIYCPVAELKYIISNTDDTSVITWYIITTAMRLSTGKTVKPSEVFGK